jgi:hypothetical protein
MEQKVLSKLSFQIACPSSYRFLERYNKLAMADEVSFYIAQYLLELSMLDYKMLKYIPSMQAASALCIAAKVLKRVNVWSEVLHGQCNYTETDLAACMKDMSDILKASDKISHQAARRKFAQPKYKEVSKNRYD